MRGLTLPPPTVMEENAHQESFQSRMMMRRHARPTLARVPDRSAARDKPVRRLPPVVQFATITSLTVEQQLRTAALIAFQEGRSIAEICDHVYDEAAMLGHHPSISVQEVFSTDLPSYPGETIASALIIVDLPNGAPFEGPTPAAG